MPSPIKIIAGFPGVGKSFYQKNNPECLDSDSSFYSAEERFPDSYMQHIVRTLQENKYNVILVSTHAVVLEAMCEYGFRFTVVYPHIDLKEEYLERYRQRQSPPALIKIISDNWDDWITALEASSYKNRRLISGQFLADVMEEL